MAWRFRRHNGLFNKYDHKTREVFKVFFLKSNQKLQNTNHVLIKFNRSPKIDHVGLTENLKTFP